MSHAIVPAPHSVDAARCPFCRAAEVVSTSPNDSESAYLRCEGCGEIWHPGRLLPPRARPRPF